MSCQRVVSEFAPIFFSFDFFCSFRGYFRRNSKKWISFLLLCSSGSLCVCCVHTREKIAWKFLYTLKQQRTEERTTVKPRLNVMIHLYFDKKKANALQFNRVLLIVWEKSHRLYAQLRFSSWRRHIPFF